MAVDRIASAQDHEAFIAACAETVAAGRHCTIDEGALLRLTEEIRHFHTAPFDNWLRRDAGPCELVGFDGYLAWLRQSFPYVCFNAALNGGFFEKTPAGGIRQWARGGSGARALAGWIDGLWETCLQPGIDIHNEADAVELLTRTMDGQTQQEWRHHLAARFADETINRQLLGLYDDMTAQRRIDLRHTDRLAQILPDGFGFDPFRKKAILALNAIGSLIADNAGSQTFDLNLPIAADYQIPRIMQWKGVIDISAGLEAALNGPDLLDPLSSEVVEFRAAAVLACEHMSRILAISSWDVDGRIFVGFRHEPDFIANSMPPMRCDSTWF